MSHATHRRLTHVGPEADPQASVVGPPPVAPAQVENSPTVSPARTVQERLAEDYRLVTDPDEGRRWAPRATLAFSGGISLALWAGIALALGWIH